MIVSSSGQITPETVHDHEMPCWPERRGSSSLPILCGAGRAAMRRYRHGTHIDRDVPGEAAGEAGVCRVRGGSRCEPTTAGQGNACRTCGGPGPARAGVSGRAGFLRLILLRRWPRRGRSARGRILRRPMRADPSSRSGLGGPASSSLRSTNPPGPPQSSGGHAPSPPVHSGYTLAASAAALASTASSCSQPSPKVPTATPQDIVHRQAGRGVRVNCGLSWLRSPVT